MHSSQQRVSTHRKLLSLHIFTVVLGLLLIIARSESQEEYGRVSRKLLSSPDISEFSNEELHELLSLLQEQQANQRVSPSTNDGSADKVLPSANPTMPSRIQTSTMLLPELLRRSPQTITTTSTTTSSPPVSRITTRRFYRRLRRKRLTTTTEAPSSTEAPQVSSTENSLVPEAEAPRSFPPTGASPQELLTQLSLLNGILGALNSSSASAPSPSLAPSASPSPTPTASNANSNKIHDVGTAVPDFLAILTGAKAEASTKKEIVVPPPNPTHDPAATLALLNLFSGSSSETQKKPANDNSMANLLNLVAQASPQPSAQPSVPSKPESDTTAALTKLLLQSSLPASQTGFQTNSINQPQTSQHTDSAAQLNNLLGLLGTLGGAAGQQPQAGNINNLFNLGGDQVAQAQTNSLATLFGGQQQQNVQGQNLLNLFGGNQGNQGLNLASLLSSQPAGNAIPGLGLLSTVSSLGSSLFSTVSNIFGGSLDGKPRVRGVDTRVGLGYRLGNIGDAQLVWDIGPQLFTDPLRNEMRQYTSKRESGAHHSGSPTTAERHVQETEAKRRMVQAAVQNQYRGDHDHFASVYPNSKPSYKRSSSNFHDYSYTYNENPYSFAEPVIFTSTTPSPTTQSSYFGYIFPFADHLKGFWTGLTTGLNEDGSVTSSPHHNFDDIRTGFGSNLIKRSSQDYTDYESRAYHPRRRDEDTSDPFHSTLTDYERMLLQRGKTIGIANTKPSAMREPSDESKSEERDSYFARWFKSVSNSKDQKQPRRVPPSPPLSQSSEWDLKTSSSNEYPGMTMVPPPRQQTGKNVSPQKRDEDGSFNKRNTARGQIRRNGPRPHKRRSHNPFRNWLSSFRNSGQKQKHQAAGFGRRHFKRPPHTGNPKLQHFTNMNKDLMMADANIPGDEFLETAAAGIESYVPPAFDHPLAYEYANEFPDVPITLPPRRLTRPTAASAVSFTSKVRTSLSQREKVVEPALLYDHLQIEESDRNVYPEAEESFSSRNRVVVNPILKEIEKKKVLGSIRSTPSPSLPPTKAPPSLLKLQRQRFRLTKNRANLTTPGIMGINKHKIAVKVRGSSTQHKLIPAHAPNSGVVESTTALPSVLSTISSIFSATTKPRILNDLIHNATSFLPSISNIHILPRKKTKEYKTRLTLVNGKPTILGPPADEEEEELEEAADEIEPVVHIGDDMSFTDLKSIFGGKNDTKRRRFRIRVKESLLRGETEKGEADVTERKDSDEEEDDTDAARDIFVDIESGEVSVLKPVASLVSFAPKKEEPSVEEVDYYEDDDGDGVADVDMKRREHIFDAIQKQLVRNFEKMKKAQLREEAKKRRKQELAEKGIDESIDVVTKFFDVQTPVRPSSTLKIKKLNPIETGGLM